MTEIKRCACGRSYDHVAWCELPKVQDAIDDPSRVADYRWRLGVDEYGLDLRNCPCGSTISVRVPGGRIWEVQS